MIHVSAVVDTAPKEFKTELQEKVYEVLEKLQIPYQRVDCDPAITMEDCEAIDAALEVKTVKTLFLCNRQKTNFYLLVMPGDKRFVTKDFSKAMNISRVSFAPADLLKEMCDTEVGATTIFSRLLASAAEVQVVVDQDVLKEEYYGCTDGTLTSYMKLPTKRVMEDFMNETKSRPIMIEQ